MKSKSFLIGIISVTIVVFLSVLNHFGILAVPPNLLMMMRWIAILILSIPTFYKKTLTTWIIYAMLVGVEIGNDFPAVAVDLKILSDVFLKMIKTIIAPLLFGTLVVGIAAHSNLKQVGRMGIKALIYFEVVTTLALFIGLAAINISGAGKGIAIPEEASTETIKVAAQSWKEIVLHIFPENIAKSIADGQVLQIVVFSILFAIGLAMVDEKKRQPVIAFAEGLSEAMFKFTNIIMYFAPFAVGGAIAYTIGKNGLEIFVNLISLLATLYIALIVFLSCVLLPIALLAGVPVKKFIKAVTEPASIAFATASSESALPRAMEAMETLGVPRKIVAFVLPTGYSFNLDGSTLYLSLASVFVAQVAGIEMSFGQQMLMVFTLMLTSKGVAGVPRASLVILSGTAASFGLPTEPIFIILGIDALMDMGRTSVNVIGNCLASVVVAKWEGEFVEN